MQYRHPVTGRKVSRSTEQNSKKEALKVAGRWEQEVREGREQKHGSIAWSEFRQRYEDEVVAGLAAMTDRKIASVLNGLEKAINPQRLADVDSEALTTYQKCMRDDGRSENTIKSHLAHVRAALAWAVDLGLLTSIPTIPKTHRAKATRVMKGRPITTEEFERMLGKVEAGLLDGCGTHAKKNPKRKPSETEKSRRHERLLRKVEEIAPSWVRLLRGLWWSGLRLTEALDLHWEDERHLCVDLSYHHPMLRVPAEKEKGHKDRLMPLSPEFAKFLLETPESQRRGYVFTPLPQRIDKNTDRLGKQQVSAMISRIGKAANVKVTDNGRGGRPKFASAHDLRRAFGARWAARVMPQILMELMRHESIETTLRYYVGRNAQATASVLWEAMERNPSSTTAAGSEDSLS